MNTECHFKIYQGGMVVAKGAAPHDAAVSQAMHYALMYGQDGPVSWTVHEVYLDSSGRRRRRKVLSGKLQGVSLHFKAAKSVPQTPPTPTETGRL